MLSWKLGKFRPWDIIHIVLYVCIPIFELLYSCMGQSLWYPFEWSPCITKQGCSNHKWFFPREQTLTIYTASRVFCLWIACIIIILGYSCTNTPTVCSLESFIISFRRLKIHTHIVLVNPQQNICMWIFEVLGEDRDPAYIAVQSSGISYWTTLTLIVLLVHIKDNLKHYS